MKRYDPLTGGFSDLSDFLITVRKCVDREIQSDRRLDDIAQKTLTEGSDSGGGFTVPEKWADEIYHASLEDSIVRSRAHVHKMTSDTENIPTLVDTNRGTNIFGGITLSWTVLEGEEKSTSAGDPVFGQVKLKAREGIAYCWVQNQLEDDVKNFEKYMKYAFGKALAFYEDEYFINGNGVQQPLGIMNSGYTIPATRTGVDRIDIADIGNMAVRLLPGSWKNAVWLINQSVLAQWVEMQSVANNSASVINLAEMRILGAPVIVTEKCFASGTTGDIILASFGNGYVIGDRSMTIEGSRHANYDGTSGFLQNQTGWRMVLRVDGQPIRSTPITPLRGGSTLSDFVCLTTAS